MEYPRITEFEISPPTLHIGPKLQPGLTMAKVVALTKSLGRCVDEAREVYAWADDGGSSVTITFANGRCADWVLARPGD